MLTDAELNELEELLDFEKIDSLHLGLTNITESTSPNYKLLHESISNQKWGNDEKGEPKLIDGFVGAVLEGSSRSTKTWSGIDIIIWLSTIRHKEEGCTINIYRQTYNEFKTTIYEDFRRRLDHFGLDNPFHRAKELSSFRIGKSTVNLLGDGKFGGGCDYAFFNEVMFITQDVFKQVTMRCRKFWWMDFNPCFTVHWVFESVIPRLDVAYIRTTFKDNPFIAPNELNTIRGYEPWESGSYEIRDEEIFYKGLPVGEKNQPPPNIKNVEQGTASVFDWLVYGLGLRGSMEGVIIEHINWVAEFPDLDYIYGNDFGFTVDPNSLVKYAETETDIFFELLCYEPIDTDTELANYFENVEVEKNKLIVCDSSDKYTGENKGTVEMVKGLRKAGYMARKVKKSKSIMYWLGSMKKKRLNCVKSHLWRHVKTEQENYKFKKVMGITVNQPIDKYNHCFSSDTLVLTDLGYKQIVDIKIGDFVINSFGKYKVINSFLSAENAPTIDSEISCGIHKFSLTSTKEHKVKTLNGWKEIQEIKKGDYIWTFKNSMASLTTYTKMKDTSQKAKKDFIELYGNSTMERSQKENISTIKIITQSIIVLAILLCLMPLNILVNIKNNIAQKIKKRLKNILTKLDRKQRSGTHQKKASIGILNTLKNTILEILHTAKEIVMFAILNLNQKQNHRNSALTIVNHNTAGKWDLIMNLGTASFVGMNLKLINIPKEKPVPRNVKEVKFQKAKNQDVYDLSIETKHEFSANDVIVHNCFDAVRYCHIAHNMPQMEMNTEKTPRQMGINY